MKTSSQNKNSDYISAIGSMGLGAYCGSRALTSGLRRALGVRIEEHTTSAKNAKAIIQNSKILDPKFGGKGCARIVPHFTENSGNFVHITGFHKDLNQCVPFNQLKDAVKIFVPDKNKQRKLKKYIICFLIPLF